MGMYNEVFKKCPKCGGRGYMQISQIVLGFGDFDLDRPSSLEDYSEAELLQLESHLRDEDNRFVCGDQPFADGGCGRHFTYAEAMGERAGKQEAIERLTGRTE